MLVGTMPQRSVVHLGIHSSAWNRIRYTLWAPLYDRIAGLPEHRRRSVELLRPSPQEEILLLGAGTGADLPYLPAACRITAIDVTPAMLARLERRAARLGRSVEVHVMDGQALTFPSGRFDAVILHLILAVVPDPVACIREAERVLRPGGRAVVFDKFLPDDREPSLLWRLANRVTSLLATDITRKLGPLVAETGLVVEHRESHRILGLPFEIALLRKPGAG